MTQPKFRTIPKAPTLMDALVQTQARVVDLEIRIEHIETYLKQYHGGHVEHREISDEYYGDGMRGEPELDDTIDDSDEVV